MGRKENFCSVPDPGCLGNTSNMQNGFACWYLRDVPHEKIVQFKTLFDLGDLVTILSSKGLCYSADK